MIRVSGAEGLLCGRRWFFYFFGGCRFGVVLGVLLLFGGVFRFVSVLFCY